MGEGLPNLDVVEWRILGIEEQIIGAEVAVVRVELFESSGSFSTIVLSAGDKHSTTNIIDLIGLIRGEVS